MSYLSHNPFRDLDVLRREFNRLFDAPEFSRWTRPFSRVAFLPGVSARAYPLIRLSDDGTNLYVEALAPGIDPQRLKISVVKNQFTIEGEKAETRPAAETRPGESTAETTAPAPAGAKGVLYHRNERAAGSFARTLTLPVEIDAEHVTAQYQDGLLKITLPRSEAARPKTIKVSVN